MKALLFISVISFLNFSCKEENSLRGSGQEAGNADQDRDNGLTPDSPSDYPPGGPVIPTSGGQSYEFTGADTIGYQSDIIFLLDGSDSMKTKINQTLAKLNSLITNYLSKVQGFDYQLIIAGGNVGNLSGPNIGKVSVSIGSHSALNAGKQIIEGKLPVVGGKGAIRPSAVKELVVVSDDNASESMAAFHTWMDQNPTIAANVHVSGIVALQRKCGGFVPDIYATGAIGRTYIDLASHQRTTGALGDICTQGSWQPIFDALGASLSQKKSAPTVTFQLANPPLNPAAISVTKNGQPISQSLVQFNAATNQLTILTATLPSDRISVTY